MVARWPVSFGEPVTGFEKTDTPASLVLLAILADLLNSVTRGGAWKGGCQLPGPTTRYIAGSVVHGQGLSAPWLSGTLRFRMGSLCTLFAFGPDFLEHAGLPPKHSALSYTEDLEERVWTWLGPALPERGASNVYVWHRLSHIGASTPTPALPLPQPLPPKSGPPYGSKRCPILLCVRLRL